MWLIYQPVTPDNNLDGHVTRRSHAANYFGRSLTSTSRLAGTSHHISGSQQRQLASFHAGGFRRRASVWLHLLLQFGSAIRDLMATWVVFELE
jgi:hypothetical protein